MRVASTHGHTEPQWEAGDATVATVDGVRLIACELARADGTSSLVALGVAPDGATASADAAAHAAGRAAGGGAGTPRRVVQLPAVEGVCGSLPIELRLYGSEGELLVAFEAFVQSEADPDLLLTYDARCLGLVASRHAELVLGLSAGARPKPSKAKKASAGVGGSASGSGGGGGGGGGAPFNLSRDPAETTRVVPIVTYGKAWQAKGGRQQTAENLETTEVTGLSGRFSCDLLRALVCHQAHKLTTHSFAQAVSAVLGEETELVMPEVLRAAPIERVARHAAQQARQVRAVCGKLKTIEETVEMARLTGLPLRTICNQAQMVRTENLLLKAARTLHYALPLNTVPIQLRWPAAQMPSDGRAYQVSTRQKPS